MEEWDSIGVNGCVGAEDEYDRYADKAYVMLIEGRSAAEIADYLHYIASDYMGLRESDGRRRLADRIAQRLVQLYPSLIDDSNEPF